MYQSFDPTSGIKVLIPTTGIKAEGSCLEYYKDRGVHIQPPAPVVFLVPLKRSGRARQRSTRYSGDEYVLLTDRGELKSFKEVMDDEHNPKWLEAILFKTTDIPGNVLKWAPDFCTVYVVSKGKINTVRNATRPVPTMSAGRAPLLAPRNMHVEPATHDNSGSQRWYDEMSTAEMEHSIAYSGRPSTDSNFFYFYENLTRDASPRHSDVYEPYSSGFTPNQTDNNGLDNGRASWSSSVNNMEEYEEEMRRLNIELKQTVDMYHAACKEAVAAKQEAAAELEEWKREKEKKLKEAHIAEENALAMAEREKSKCHVAIGAAEAVQKLVKIEVQKRMDAEMKALRENEEKQKVLDALGQSQSVLKYQSLFHMIAVLFLFYFYFSVFN
ncbi:hypothetical protein GH714_003530 [Hevea brasiliensis]|uniref:RING-type E3 ubiquitin transferase n=1 Tax=Hevea brasiliensis TaxID=3981 RepID=A0A6A6KPF1_HEVBR|nr:hypothetical protein GH714_003530 [Hevea brasiliensis]